MCVILLYIIFASLAWAHSTWDRCGFLQITCYPYWLKGKQFRSIWIRREYVDCNKHKPNVYGNVSRPSKKQYGSHGWTQIIPVWDSCLFLLTSKGFEIEDKSHFSYPRGMMSHQLCSLLGVMYTCLSLKCGAKQLYWYLVTWSGTQSRISLIKTLT